MAGSTEELRKRKSGPDQTEQAKDKTCDKPKTEKDDAKTENAKKEIGKKENPNSSMAYVKSCGICFGKFICIVCPVTYLSILLIACPMMEFQQLVRVTPNRFFSFQLKGADRLWEPAWLAPAAAAPSMAIGEDGWVEAYTQRCFGSGSAWQTMATQSATGFGSVAKDEVMARYGKTKKFAVGWPDGTKAIWKSSHQIKAAIDDYSRPDYNATFSRIRRQHAGASIGSEVVGFHLDCLLGLHRAPPSVGVNYMASTVDSVIHMPGGPYIKGQQMKRTLAPKPCEGAGSDEDACAVPPEDDAEAAPEEEEEGGAAGATRKHSRGDFVFPGSLTYYVKGVEKFAAYRAGRTYMKMICLNVECVWERLQSPGYMLHSRFGVREDNTAELFWYLMGTPLHGKTFRYLPDQPNFGHVLLHFDGNDGCVDMKCITNWKLQDVGEVGYDSLGVCRYHRRVIDRARALAAADPDGRPLAAALRASLLRDPVAARKGERCSSAENRFAVYHNHKGAMGIGDELYKHPLDDAPEGEPPPFEECGVIWQVEHVVEEIDDRLQEFLGHVAMCEEVHGLTEVYDH